VATTGGGALELLTRLRDDWITVPVVILTAYDDAGLSEVAFSLGAARDVPEGRDGRRMPQAAG
jgi:DNA-binding NarL/FixJ family response regulator